jgi:hypothetical protein
MKDVIAPPDEQTAKILIPPVLKMPADFALHPKRRLTIDDPNHRAHN